MSSSISNALASYVERARKVLQHEQRTHHQDQAIKPGGLELFVARWADEASAACKNAGLDINPVHRFTEHLEGYRSQDPMQRAASLRAALAILNELDNSGPNNHVVAPVRSQTPANSISAQADKTERKDSAVSARPVPTDGKAAPDLARLVQGTQNKQAISENPIYLEAGMSAGHASLTLLSADVTAVPGVGASIAAKLHSLGIRTVRDLLFYFPRQHRDYSKL